MSTVNFKYENGDILKDKVTGYQGVVMVRAEYSTGCLHYGLQGNELKDGMPPNWEWLDSTRLELVKSAQVIFDIDTSKPSGSFPSGPS